MRVRGVAVAAAALVLSLAPAGGQGDGAPGGQGDGAPATVSARIEGLPEQSPPGDRVRQSKPVRAPIPFTMLGLQVPGRAGVGVRTSVDGAAWTGWTELATLGQEDDGPDRDEAAQAGDAWRRHTSPLWVGEARFLQVRLTAGNLKAVVVHLIDSGGLSRPSGRRLLAGAARTLRPAPRAAVAGHPHRPRISSRAAWGAQESWRRGRPRYAASVRFGVVHHTASGNRYTPEQAAAVVRGIYHYHTRTLGWNDLGYNLLVDRYGRVYEGRAGGVERGVVGSHAAGFNAGSFGVALIGSFEHQRPPAAALSALSDVLAWKTVVHRIRPLQTVTVTSGGSSRYPRGQRVRLPTLSGHRDVGSTACPGDALYRLLPRLRRVVAQRVGALQFDDIAGSPHRANIAHLAAAGITAGCGSRRYCPAAWVTRGQMASLLVRASPRLKPVRGQRFRDVPPDHPHGPAINAVVDAGIAEGYPDGTFRPNLPVARDEMATFLRRALRLKPVIGTRFSDVSLISPHRPSILAIVEARVATGCARDRYCPARPVTRAEMATFVARSMDRGL